MPLWSLTKVSLFHVSHSSDLNKFPSPFYQFKVGVSALITCSSTLCSVSKGEVIAKHGPLDGVSSAFVT